MFREFAAKLKPALHLTMIFMAFSPAGMARDPAGPVSNPAAADPGRIAVLTPDAHWRLRVTQVLQSEKGYLVEATLHRDDGPATQALHPAVAALPRFLRGHPVTVYIVGKTWRWKNTEPYAFVATAADIPRPPGARVVPWEDPENAP